MTEADLRKFMEWLMDEWAPANTCIPFYEDAAIQYMKKYKEDEEKTLQELRERQI